jgi:ArsR family transcriptional regulator
MSPRQAAACCRPVDGLLDPAFFKALGDPTRVKLLACLIKCGRACGVGEVADCCAVDLSVVSRHLQSLARAGLVQPTRTGRQVSYQVRYADLCRTLRGLADAVEECAPAAANATAACCQGACRARR